MKVALVHDYIKEYGGAERVLEALHEVYPDATVFTSVYLPRFLGPHRERFKGWKIKTSWFQYVPFNHKLISPFRLIAPFVFKDLSDFDVVIVSATGAYFPNMVRTKNVPAGSKSPLPPFIKGATSAAPSLLDKEGGPQAQAAFDAAGGLVSRRSVHICYCHTPPRYLYGYATAREWKKNKMFAVLAGVANHFLRMVDFHAAQNVDFYIANSEEVASRIKKFYRRDATVIYPPVDIPKKMPSPSNIAPRPYYLTGGRLARAKHVDLIVRACSELGVPLKVFGKSFAGYGEELQEISNSQYSSSERSESRSGEGSRLRSNNIKFLGEITDEKKAELMAGAKAFLFASEDEDFGIVPVEAMGYGVPVIAHHSGGVKETVLEGKTGTFFEKLTVESLKGAIKKFEKMKIRPEDCRKQAEKFSKERFEKEIKKFVSSVL
jgi:glycosyltransferase involved in cell wall biosynthesis